MIGFFKKKEQKNINIRDKFNWINGIENQRLELSEQDLEERLLEIKSVHGFLKSKEGEILINTLFKDMIEIGFPEASTKIELDLLSEIFSPETLIKMFFNPSNGLENSYYNGRFNDFVKVDDRFAYIIAPKGFILIVGSSNTILPVITSIILSYICGNVTVCQLSKLNSEIISKFINSIPSNCSKYTHYTNLDHTETCDVDILKQILVEIPWNVINVWGGEEANSFYFQNISKNPSRPRILNMEALTGIVIIQKSFLENNLKKISSELALSICEMGQQLCSSPTEGFILNDCNNTEIDNEFFISLIDDLEKNFIDFADFETSYFKLDRMLTNAQDNKSKVYNSKKYGNKISIIKSENQSIFRKIDNDQNLTIHERRNFLELIEVKSFELILQLIKNINKKNTHREIKKIQTILVFGEQEFNTNVLKLAKKIGAYRVVDYNYIFKRHPLEALDGSYLINEFTYHLSVIGSIPFKQTK